MARGKIEYWSSAEGLAYLESWTEEKLTDVEIAGKIGISRSTLSEWKKKNKFIASALDFSEEKANRKKYQYWISEDGMLLVRAWARNGLTDEQLAEKLGVSRSTLGTWKIKYPEFAKLLSKTKEIVDTEIENASAKAATGYFYTEQVAFKVKTVTFDKETGKRVSEEEHIETADLQRWQPADVKAIIWWLKNRNNEAWKDHPELNKDDPLVKLLMEVITSTEQVK